MEAIAAMVPAGTVLADIGTDHALLPAALVKRGVCPKAYAGDVAEGPLHSAETNLAKDGLLDRVIPVLSDGFRNIPVDADCAVIAGMGFYTAVHILDDAEERLGQFIRIIVQINNEAPAMRRYISSHGWEILEERYVRDRGKDYEITAFCTRPHEPYTEEEIFLGPCLMQEGNEEYMEYCRRRYDNAVRLNRIRREHGQEEDAQLVFTEQCLRKYLGV